MRGYLIGISIFILVLSSCLALNVPKQYILDEKNLKDILKNKEPSLVLYRTDWCPASGDRIEKLYKPLQKRLKKIV
ncbi:MAG: hypothetical protein AB8B72_02930 [Crocinitomicaceae bacterium]